MKRISTYTICWFIGATSAYAQVKPAYEYNTSMPYGTLDLRTRISSSDYYFLRENETFSFRERSPGVKTNTYLDMTGWDSSPYKEGHLRRKVGTTEAFVMNYRLLFPAGYNSTYAKGYPMIVHLHGAHERANCLYNQCYHADWDYTVQENSPPAPTDPTHKLLNNDHSLDVGGKQYLDARNLAGTRLPDDPSMPDRAFPGFVLVPQMFNIWDSLQAEDVVRIVRLLADKYRIDEDRIYIQGLSIGGHAVYEAVKRASWLFAAALPMSSVTDGNIFLHGQQGRVAHMPLWVFQGGVDKNPTPDFTEDIIRKFRAAGAVVRYTKYADLGHNIWTRSYGLSDYYTWMLSQSKANLHAHGGNLVIDRSKDQYPKLMLAEGFLAYQWEKDGAILGHTGNALTVTAPGRYRARFSRISTSPSGAQWNEWSPVVTITETGSPAPTVTVNITQPDDNQTFTAPASINVTATASVSDGSVSKVEFYNGGTKLGEDSSAPYDFTWGNVPAGNYTISAKATDHAGNSATDKVTISVNSAPAVNITAPNSGDTFTAPASITFVATASDSDGTIAGVEFYHGSTKLGEDTSSPYDFTWGNVPSGNYTITAKATDNDGASATDKVTVGVGNVPAVSITNPEDGQSFIAPASVSIAAAASSSDGNISRVEFYNGSSRLGEDTSSPYTFTWSNVSAGTYTIAAKATDNAGRSATDRITISVGSVPVVNITNPDDGQIFTAPASISLAATASDADGSIARVEFYNGGTKLGQDATSPYTFTWSNVAAGDYSLIAKAVDDSGNSATDAVGITVNASSGEPGEPGTTCASAGSIQVETWTDIPGREISSIPVNTTPSSVVTVTMFETEANIGDHYGSRVRGYICPPLTGSYRFWIASNDNGELWLSTDEHPANRRKIAYVSGYTNPRQWDKQASQQSATVSLVAGTRYYIEALVKEGSGSDHLAVGWQLPGGTLERPIPGERLIPFQASGGNNPPAVNVTSPDNGQVFTAPASISFTATASDSDGSVARVEFYNGGTKLGQDATSPYAFTWSSVPAGDYSLIAKAIDNSGASASDRVDITVNAGSTGSCASTGIIQAETWTGIEGREISSIPVNSTPSSVRNLTLFETPANTGDHYGTRVRGFVCVPATGLYTFWIASNDTGELWLSTDDSPANKRKIAYVSGWTNPRDWDKYATQRSATVTLTEGRRYYIEALVKEGTGSDHLAVGWQLPGGALERPIPGPRLVSFDGGSTSGSTSNDPPTVRITSPDDGQTFTAPASINITATASDGDGTVSKVEFYNGGTRLGQDATSPYTFSWSNVPAGSYTLIAKATDNSGTSATDRIEISVGAGGDACASTGTIQAETWTGIEGRDISSIPVNTAPSSVVDLTRFETDENTADHYGTRVRGYICVPVTGNYVFWIASNDTGELWLSADGQPANKVKIASVSGWTYPREWDKYSTQRSAAVHLVEGTRCYIEALVKEGTGSDHLSVGWQLPGGALERPIPGSRLSPFGTSQHMTAMRMGTAHATLSSADESSYSAISVYPNPVERTDVRLTLGGYEGITRTIETAVEIINLTGEVVFSERIRCGGSCGEYLLNINKQLTPGVYIVKMETNGIRHAERLFVR